MIKNYVLYVRINEGEEILKCTADFLGVPVADFRKMIAIKIAELERLFGKKPEVICINIRRDDKDWKLFMSKLGKLRPVALESNDPGLKSIFPDGQMSLCE
ncbi:MAG: hypothetical protein WCT19_02880 [Candidatus Paceibacterota bacterium]